MDINNISLPFNLVAEKKTDCILVSLTNKNSEMTFMPYNIEDIDVEKLGIIKGDIFDISYGSNCKGFNIICNFNHDVPKTAKDTKKCVGMINEYYRIMDISFDDYPCFFVIDCEYPDVDKVLGNFVREGFSTCDHLVDFENNRLLVKTSKSKLKAMSMYYSLRNKMAGFTFGVKLTEEDD